MKHLLSILLYVFAHVAYAQSLAPSGTDILNLAIKELPVCAVSQQDRIGCVELTVWCVAAMHAHDCCCIIMRAYRYRMHQRQPEASE